jgi:hypothetical protein
MVLNIGELPVWYAQIVQDVLFELLDLFEIARIPVN